MLPSQVAGWRALFYDFFDRLPFLEKLDIEFNISTNWRILEVYEIPSNFDFIEVNECIIEVRRHSTYTGGDLQGFGSVFKSLVKAFGVGGLKSFISDEMSRALQTDRAVRM